MDKTFWGIFKIFFKIGTILLGGGYVILPLLASELVDKKRWITYDELLEYYTISASLPGIIAANTAIFTGKKLLGLRGVIAAICGIILPAFVAIILLATIMNEIVSKNFVQNIFWGVGIGVITLLFIAIKDMWKKSVNDKFSVIIYLICLILTLSKKVSLAIIVIGAIVIGIMYQLWQDNGEHH